MQQYNFEHNYFIVYVLRQRPCPSLTDYSHLPAPATDGGPSQPCQNISKLITASLMVILFPERVDYSAAISWPTTQTVRLLHKPATERLKRASFQPQTFVARTICTCTPRVCLRANIFRRPGDSLRASQYRGPPSTLSFSKTIMSTASVPITLQQTVCAKTITNICIHLCSVYLLILLVCT